MKGKTSKLLLFVILAMAVISMTLFTACGDNGDKPSTPANTGNTGNTGFTYENKDYGVGFLTDYSLGEEFTSECVQQGEIVDFTYTTHSYTLEALPENEGTQITLEKTAQIYLPYGYDSEGEYDILYLLHGTGDEQELYWFTVNEPTTANVLDNMIYKEMCKPTIVVCPNYYSIPDDYEPYKNVNALNDPNADLWPMYFYKEIRNDLIPAVEAEYATYAHGDTSLENLQATRDHRAFAGLSRGSMTVVNSGMMHCTDLFSYFGSYSGIWADADDFKDALTGEFDNYEIKYWYNGTGTSDTVGSPRANENQLDFTTKALENMPEKFKDGENFALIVIQGGKHEYKAWITDLYNSMLVFFK